MDWTLRLNKENKSFHKILLRTSRKAETYETEMEH